jgi:predicted  nucleic acid-binding Zn-ribbon protein
MKLPWIQIQPDDTTRDKLQELINSQLNMLVYLQAINRKGNAIMADIANISEDLDQIKAGVTNAIQAITDLQAQIAAIQPGAATQEQLDALDVKTEEIKAMLTPATP